MKLRECAGPWPIALCVAAAAITSVAGAQDQAAQPLMSTPSSYTDVADAFEPGNPIDVNVHLDYLHETASGSILREQVDASAADGRSSRHLAKVADHSEQKNELDLRLEVGVYHDLMIFIRLPVVLNDDNRVTGTGSTAAQPVLDLSRALVSARRSGLPSVDLGVAWALTNQARLPHLPTWVLMLETSFDTGAVMRACLSGEQGCSPGLARGVDRLKLESRWSYRRRQLEPFFGLSHQFAWVSRGDSLYHPSGELAGIADDGPPSITEGTLGLAIIPWEDRLRFQRFEIEVAGKAALISNGRDVSPLFDALGASSELKTNTSASLAGAAKFTGITNVDAHSRVSLNAQVLMQAARYVRFGLGFGMTALGAHLITGAPACDGAIKAAANDPRGLGCANGIANPAYRAAIDAPGQRFKLESALAFRLQASAAAQF